MITARQFFQHPVQTGALTAAKPCLAHAMVKAANIGERQSIVEFGPGSGSITESIVRELGPASHFFAIELNKAFAHQTQERFPNIDVYVDNATNLRRYLDKAELSACDAIVSSLPWTLIRPKQQDELLDVVLDCLAPKGVFVTYIYSISHLSPNCRAFVKKLKNRFEGYYHRESVLRNMPPAQIFICGNPNA